MICEIINPSDKCTIRTENFLAAAAGVALVSTKLGLVEIGGEERSTPVLFGWNEWCESHGINDAFIATNWQEIAESLESIIYGDAGDRASVEYLAEKSAKMGDTDYSQFVREWNERKRSSMNDISAAFFGVARRLRSHYGAKEEAAPCD